ncbi:MAG: ATP-binding protein [Pseudomonadota bacterium]
MAESRFAQYTAEQRGTGRKLPMDLTADFNAPSLWSPESWRAKAAVLLSWLSLAMSVFPIGFSAYQDGIAIAAPYAAIAVVGLLILVFGRLKPRYIAMLLTLFWFIVAAYGVFTLGLISPIMVTSLSIAGVLGALFYSKLGLILSLLTVSAIVILAGIDEFFLGFVPMTPEHFEVLRHSPGVYLRQGVSTITAISVLCVSVFFIASMQERSLQRLREEAMARKKSELAFRAAQKAELVSQLTSGLSHNFSNALTVITTWTELLGRNPERQDFVERAAKDMAQAAQQATMVSREIMMLGKNYVRQREVLDPAEALDGQFMMLRTLLPANVKLTSSMDSGCPISIDRSELQQILLNLVLNAKDAVSRDGRIDVVLRCLGEHVALEVTDNGEGMDDELLQHIFEPFFTTKGQEGTGLGLSSIKQSVESLGGSIDVKSAVGEGTTFTLLFNRAESEPEETSTDETGSFAVDFRARILVVDDEDIVLRALTTGLEQVGHSVSAAADVDDAINAISSCEDIDLLITDAVLPGGHATQVIDAFEQHFPNRPVLVCSGHVREQALADLLEDGAYAFLQKPVTVTQLRRRVQEILASSSDRRTVRGTVPTER